MRRRLCALASALLFVSLAVDAHAADVGIVARDANDPFVTRLILELSQLSLSATRAESVESSRDTAVLVVGDDLELVDLRSQKRQKLLATRSDALKVAEELHALMLPLVARPPAPEPAPAAPPPPPPPPPPPKEEPIAPASPPKPSFEASAGGGAIFGASSPGLAVSASLAWFPIHGERSAFGVAASGVFAAIAENVSRTEGSADVRPLLFGPEIVGRYALAPPLAIDAGLGAFAAYVAFRGDAAAPFAAQSDEAWTFSPALRLRMQLLFGTFGLYVEGRGGLAIPSIAVRFAGEAVREWGRPWATAGAGVSVAF